MIFIKGVRLKTACFTTNCCDSTLVLTVLQLGEASLLLPCQGMPKAINGYVSTCCIGTSMCTHSLCWSDKVRLIDNYSESQVNDAATIVSKCTVDGSDCIAGLVATYMRRAQDAGKSPQLLGRP